MLTQNAIESKQILTLMQTIVIDTPKRIEERQRLLGHTVRNGLALYDLEANPDWGMSEVMRRQQLENVNRSFQRALDAGFTPADLLGAIFERIAEKDAELANEKLYEDRHPLVEKPVPVTCTAIVPVTPRHTLIEATFKCDDLHKAGEYVYHLALDIAGQIIRKGERKGAWIVRTAKHHEIAWNEMAFIKHNLPEKAKREIDNETTSYRKRKRSTRKSKARVNTTQIGASL